MTPAEKTALAQRVLEAINKREKPADTDLFLLHLHSPVPHSSDPDELARLVMQEASDNKACL